MAPARTSFDSFCTQEFDPAFCQTDWSQPLAPPPHSPLSFPAPKSHSGTKAKVSLGWGCTGLEGVDPLQEPDRALFFSFLLIPIPSGHRRERARSLNTHERAYCGRQALLQ